MSRADVFVDSTFLVAVADPSSERHDAARTAYRELIDGAREARLSLVSHAVALGAASERLAHLGREGRDRIADLAAPIDVDPVHPDVWRLAENVLARRSDLDLAQAVTLAVLDRRHIGTIATFDDLYGTLDVRVLPPPTT